VHAAIRELLSALPTRTTVSSAEGLKSALSQSGQFLESQLASLPGSVLANRLPSDFKANLLRLLHVLATLNQRSAATPTTPNRTSGGTTTPNTAGAAQGTASGTASASPPGTNTSAPAPRVQGAPHTATTAGTRPAATAPPAAAGGTGNAAGTATGTAPSGNAPVTGGATGITTGTTAQGNPPDNLSAAAGARSAPPAGEAKTAATPLPPASGGGDGESAARTTPAPPRRDAAPGEPASRPNTTGNAVAAKLDQYAQAAQRATPAGTATARAMPAESPALPGSVELQHQVESALARIQLNQLSSLPTEDMPRPAMVIELPLRNGETTDIIRLHIEQETRHAGEDEPRRLWRVMLSFDLGALGPCHASVTVCDNQVVTDLWAENSATSALFARHMQFLQQNLTDAGLEIGRMNFHHGAPPPQRRANTPLNILNTRA
jgi:hypothetical protein